jgi:hypothetical protein
MRISMERRSRPSLVLLVGITLMCYPVWGAATLTVTGVNFNGQNFKTTTANGLTSQTGTVANCMTTGGNVIAALCTDTAFVVDNKKMVATSSSTFASPKTFNGTAPTKETFSTAFANVTNAKSPFFQKTLQGWTIVNGGTLDVSIVAQFTVIPDLVGNQTTGGMFLVASVDKYNAAGNQLNKGIVAPTAAQLVWTQALYVNYGPGGTAKPANTLDDYTVNSAFGANTAKPFTFPATPLPVPKGGTAAGQYTDIPTNAPRGNNQKAYADPIYGGQLDPAKVTFQGVTFNSAAGISQLLDIPGNLYSVPASFRAIGLLSAVNTSTKVITVFDDGVNYGFDLSTPEPSMLIPSLLISTLLLAAYRWRGKSNKIP